MLESFPHLLSRSRRTKKALLAVLQFEVLVGELGAVNRFSAGPIATSEVTTLDHEVFDDAMER